MADAAALSFRSSPGMTLGVEIELQVVDPTTRDLTPAVPRLLAHLGKGPRIDAELMQSMLEVRTGVCATVADVRRDLLESVNRLQAAGRDLGLAFSAAGSHPFARWSDRTISPGERYQKLIDRNRWLARRLVIFGLHVHVGMRDGPHAVAILNGLLPYLPHILALSASSPFWEGHDTGLASSRITLFEALPNAGHPCTYRSWDEFQALYAAMVRARAVKSVKDFWWDIRLHPEFGTLEVRICDGLSTLSETMALVALVRLLCGQLDQHYREGQTVMPPPDWIVRENKWRASRWGLEADIVLDLAGRTGLLRDELSRLLPTLETTAATLGCSPELQRVGQILEEGPSYIRQRRAFDRAGRIEAVVDAMVEEFATDRPYHAGGAEAAPA